MSHLDMKYIADLVPQAQTGDSNAFAELFAATYEKQFAFARSYLKDDALATEALQAAYIQALKTLPRLREPALIILWLNQITLHSCFDIEYGRSAINHEPAEKTENRRVKIDGREYPVRQIMTLPFSEAQTLLLYHLCHMKTGSIAALLEISRVSVRRYMEKGYRRLKNLSAVGGEEA